MLGQIGAPRAGAVGVGPLDHGPEPAQLGDDVVADAADDLAGLLARGPEAVERVEYGGGVPPEEGQLLQQQGAGAGAGGGDGGGRAGRARSDDDDVEGTEQGSGHTTSSGTARSRPRRRPCSW